MSAAKRSRLGKGITVVWRKGLEYLHVRVGQFHRKPAIAQKDFRRKPGAVKKARAWRNEQIEKWGLR